MKGNLFDSPLHDYFTGTKTATPEYGEHDIEKDGLIVDKHVGKKCGLSRQMNLNQADLRFRSTQIILAFLPDCQWRYTPS